MKRTVAIATFVCTVLGVLSQAQAQDEHMWLEDRRYREGIGFRVGYRK